MKTVIIVIALLIAGPAVAQPRVTNGEVRQATLSGALSRAALDAQASKAGTAWLTYAVPLVEGDRWICDGMNVTDGVSIRRDGGTGVMMLEGPRQVWVLFRLDGGRVDRIRIASEDCTLDAGGLTVNWLANVAPRDSVTTLASFLTGNASNRVADGALVALAMHREPAALEQLLSTARSGATSHARGQALFWLSQRAGEKAVGAITDAIRNDPETDVKRRAVFALSQLPKDEGIPRLIDLARSNSNPVVRKQAMFWLGQSRDPRAVKFFEEILLK
jgi:type II secretory pathway pseudopilin PulG